MKKFGIIGIFLLILNAFPLLADQQKWENVPVIDSMCLSKVKADPDKHQKKCLVQCAADSGYGILDADGNYLKLDDAGKDKVIALLNDTDKTDHLRFNVEGERNGNVIKVKSVSFHEEK